MVTNTSYYSLMDTGHLLSTVYSLPTLTPLERVLAERLDAAQGVLREYASVVNEYPEVTGKHLYAILEATSAEPEQIAALLYTLDRENVTTVEQLKAVFAHAYPNAA